MSIADMNWHFGPTDPPLYAQPNPTDKERAERYRDLLDRMIARLRSPATPATIVEDLRMYVRNAGL